MNLKKLFKIALIIFGFYLTLSLISSTFDGDFGWHLRFGADALSNNFQYADSYTWSHLNREWVNHEWGGDIVFWWLYNNFGYFSLVVVVSLALFSAYLLVPKIFGQKLTVTSIMLSILTLLSISYITMMRLTMLSPLFFIILWWSLEKIPEKKTYYYWPLILWVWSIFHGSWMLGFITINIYIAGNIWQLLINKYKNLSIQKNTWSWSVIKKVILAQIISGLVLIINPYGIRIWTEVVGYFTNSFYKTHINEWLPSYTYPVYWWPLIIVTLTGTIIYLDKFINKNKRITWPHILLFIAFFISAIQYRRNNIFLVLICLPVLVITIKKIISAIKYKHKIIIINIIALLLTIFISIKFQPTIRYNHNVWQDKALLINYGFPVDAVEFLKQKIGNTSEVRLFNRYAWGGYLNWHLPNSLVYLDGRSAATWKTVEGESLLEQYFDIMLKPNQLQFLEKNNVKYILLNKNQPDYPLPSWSDKILFSEDELKMVLSIEPYELEKEIVKNIKWKLIYNDQISNIWEFVE